MRKLEAMSCTGLIFISTIGKSRTPTPEQKGKTRRKGHIN
jgi:hypothetical protein